MAVMLNNIKAGTPQAGIGQASVIYEAPMEGADVTRLMPLFENWQNLDTIGYIRSSVITLYTARWNSMRFMRISDRLPLMSAIC